MMKKFLLATAIALPLAMPSVADTYQIEAGVLAIGGDIGDDIDLDATAIFGTYYLKEVDDSVGPKAAAAFLNKSSYVSAAYLTAEVSEGGVGSGLSIVSASDDDQETDVSSIGGRYVIPGQDIIVQGSFSSGETELGDAESDLDAYSISVGKYYNERFSLLVSYSTVEESPDDDGGVGDIEADTFGISTQYVSEAGENGNALGLQLSWSHTEVDYSESDSEPAYSTIGLSPTVFVGNDLAISFDWIITTTDLDGNAYGLSVEYFVQPNVFVVAGYDRTDYEAQDDSGEAWSVGVVGRF